MVPAYRLVTKHGAERHKMTTPCATDVVNKGAACLVTTQVKGDALGRKAQMWPQIVDLPSSTS